MEQGVEGFAVAVLLAVGVGVMMLALRVFVSRDEFAEAEEFLDSVEHAHLRRVAEAKISELCPGAIRLAEEERAGGVAGAGGSAPVREFWRRFAAASALSERDPVASLNELRGLPGLLDEALRAAGREVVAEKTCPERRTNDDA